MKNISKILLCFFLIGTFASVSFAQDTGDEQTSEKQSVTKVTELNAVQSIDIAPAPDVYVDELVKISNADGVTAFAPAIPDYEGKLPECDVQPYRCHYKLDYCSVLNKPPNRQSYII